MNTSLNKMDENSAVVELEFSPKEWQDQLSNARAVMPGEEEEKAKEFAIEMNVNQALMNFAATDHLRPATKPEIETSTNDEGDFIITAHVTLIPDVTLGQYKGLDVKATPEPVTTEEVNEAIIQQIASRQHWKTMPSDYAAENGNRVIIDFIGEKDGVPFEGGAGKETPLVLGSGSFIPGFEEQLVGIKAGESRDLDLTFPENYFEPSLAGAKVVFHVTCKEVEQELPAEMNDEVVKEMQLEGIKTVEDMQNQMRSDLAMHHRMDAEQKGLDEVLDKIVAASKITVPEILLNEQLSAAMEQQKMQLQQFGMTLDQYLSMTGQSEEELLKAMKPDVERNLKIMLVIETIAEAENITVSQQELNEEYALMERVYNIPAQQMMNMIPPNQVVLSLLQQKTLDLIKKENLIME